MTLNRDDLIDLFSQLGHYNAGNWDAIKLKGRVTGLGRVTKTAAAELTKSAQRTLFAAQAAVEAAGNGWGSEVSLAPPPKKTGGKFERRRTKLNAYPRVHLSRRDGASLFDWLKKYHYRDPRADWKKLTKDEKEEAVEEAVERIIESFLETGDVR